MAEIPVGFQRKESPFVKSNGLSRLFFWWLLKFIGLGYKRDLQLSDLYKANPEDESSYLGDLLATEWAKECERFQREEDEIQKKTKEKYPKIVKGSEEWKSIKTASPPSLFWAIKKVFLRKFLVVGILALIEDSIFKIGQPIALGCLIRFFTTPSDFPSYFGYIMAIMIVACGGLCNVTHHPYFFGILHIGMKVRIAACSLIYRKATRLSQASLERTAIGQMINLLSNDISRLDLIFFIHYIWVAPLQLIIITIILWNYFGPLAFLGMGILCIYVPCQVLVGRGFSKFRQATAIRTDRRIRVTNEILSAMQVIKMYTWEKLFSESIGRARKDEMKLIKRVSYLRTLNTLLYYISSKVIVFLTLLIFVVVYDGKLNAELAFVTLALFNNVRLAMTLFFPNAVSQIAEARVTILRLNEFLLMDERQVGDKMLEEKNEEKENKKRENPVRLNGVSAKWDPRDEDHTVENITLSLSTGKLTVVIGSVGSGKTSLLHVLLNELSVLKGSVQVEGTIGYAAQEPWLFSGSVKQNILFGRKLFPAWYNKVIDACALKTDLKILPKGDETFVGERGKMLSGGQKARITLARAVYADANILILDDPLSAVDASVGQHLFTKCINGILSSKARILVTHQLQFVHHADFIIILEDGKIKAEGTYQYLVSHQGIDFEQLGQVFKAKENSKPLKQPPLPKKSGISISSKVSKRSKASSWSMSSSLKTVKTGQNELIHMAKFLRPSGEDGKEYIPFNKLGGWNKSLSLLAPLQTISSTLHNALAPTLRDAASQAETSRPASVYSDLTTYSGTGDEIKAVHPNKPFEVLPHSASAPIEDMIDVDEYDGIGVEEVSGVAEENGGSDGKGSFALCFKYFHAGSNCCIIILFVIVNLLCQVLYTGSDYWLTIWTEAEEIRSRNKNIDINKSTVHSDSKDKSTMLSSYSTVSLKTSDEVENTTARATLLPDWKDDPLYYVYHDRSVQIWGFAIITSVFFLVSATRTLQFFAMCMRSSLALHRRMIQGVIFTRYTFIESNPTGRILNRFSKDMGQVDDEVPITFYEAISILLNMTGVLVVIGVVNVYLIIPAVVLCMFCYILRRFYVPTARSLKSLEGVSRSPVFSHMSNSLYGLTTIRAFRVEADFISQFDAHQDLHSSAWFLFIAASRWLEVWLDWVSVFYVAAVTFTFVFSTESAAEVGLAVSSAMMLTGSIQWGVRQSCQILNLMVSVDRILEYSNLPPEAALESQMDKKPPANWPNLGEVKFEHLFLQYGDKPVLKDINCTIHPSEKIGIVGRTGAGKSTLISVLFRMVEPTGKLLIDGVDVSEIGLQDLRSKISIIPQEPALFAATLRKNLDPYEKFSDEQIWSALEDCHLAKQVRTSPSGLNYHVAENGGNLSVGQRQLVSLARACLRKSKILVLDEATANIDNATDHLIQNTIRKIFKSSTVITVAHRLHTVMDCDRIMVLDNGKIIELDEPHELLKKDDGYLLKLVQQTGTNTAQELTYQAKEAHNKRRQKDLRHSQ